MSGLPPFGRCHFFASFRCAKSKTETEPSPPRLEMYISFASRLT